MPDRATGRRCPSCGASLAGGDAANVALGGSEELGQDPPRSSESPALGREPSSASVEARGQISKPTEKMLDAGYGVLIGYDSHLDDGYETLSALWEAMSLACQSGK